MAASSRAMIPDAERRFPVRIRIAVPAGGFGQRLDRMHAWLDANRGADGWMITPAGLRGVLNDAVAFYLRDAALAVGRLPESGEDLCSQPTISRLENLPGATSLKRMMAAMVDLFCDSLDQVPRRIPLDIDDTEDRVHGDQRQAGCCNPAPRQDAGRGRGGADPAPRDQPHPRPLAGGRHHRARRQPLRPARGDGVVRAPACWLHLWLGRQPRAAAPGQSVGRGCRPLPP
jgi:hypothetical protein